MYLKNLWILHFDSAVFLHNRMFLLKKAFLNVASVLIDCQNVISMTNSGNFFGDDYFRSYQWKFFFKVFTFVAVLFVSCFCRAAHSNRVFFFFIYDFSSFSCSSLFTVQHFVEIMKLCVGLCYSGCRWKRSNTKSSWRNVKNEEEGKLPKYHSGAQGKVGEI